MSEKISLDSSGERKKIPGIKKAHRTTGRLHFNYSYKNLSCQIM